MASKQSLAVAGGNRGDNGRVTTAYHKYQHHVPSKFERNGSDEDIEDLDEDEIEERDDDDVDEEEEQEEDSNSSAEAADEGVSSSSEVIIPFSWYKDQLSHPVYAHQTYSQLHQNEPNIAAIMHSNSQTMNDDANEPSEPT